ncbi:MAG TPA: hypothetical protein VJP59_04215 [Gemmatimonadota bacterium]|nr:hypothetical protein [Gemmatimonadota bacterium]
MSDSAGTVERPGELGARTPRSSRLSRFLLIPVFGLYLYLIRDSTPPMSEAERVAAFMLYMILGMLVLGSVLVKLRAFPMMILCLLGALLQTFAMMPMLLMGWRPNEAVVFVNVLLIMALLFVSWQFRSDARSGRR